MGCYLMVIYQSMMVERGILMLQPAYKTSNTSHSPTENGHSPSKNDYLRKSACKNVFDHFPLI
jgi:hypothetical protein